MWAHAGNTPKGKGSSGHVLLFMQKIAYGDTPERPAVA